MKKSQKGFTLIELMIVVAIVAIISAIAIPNFLKYQVRSRQSEARTNLGSLGTAAEAYRAEFDTYVTSIDQLGWDAQGILRYDYGYNGTAINYVNGSNVLAFDVATNAVAATETTFLAAAEGNVDMDPGEDCWTFNQDRVLNNTTNDELQNSLC